MAQGTCELCGRSVRRIERHHLIPRTRHKNRRNQRDFDRQDVRERIALLCHPCHKTVHAVLTEKELAREYNTLDALADHPQVARFVAWVRKRPDDGNIRVRTAANKGQSTRPARADRQANRRRKRRG